jgi:hypothetical protein
MKLRLLWAALVLYMLAVAVAAATAPAKRVIWPLYLPVVASAAVAFGVYRRG